MPVLLRGNGTGLKTRHYESVCVRVLFEVCGVGCAAQAGMPVLLAACGLLAATLVGAADRGPGVDADAGAEFLQAEPGAGLVCAHLEGDAFA